MDPFQSRGRRRTVPGHLLWNAVYMLETSHRTGTSGNRPSSAGQRLLRTSLNQRGGGTADLQAKAEAEAIAAWELTELPGPKHSMMAWCNIALSKA